MLLEVHWGKFVQEISVMNSTQQSRLHSCRQNNHEAKGRFCHIYFGNIKNRVHYAVKCVPFDSQSSEKAILMAVKECFLLRIASILRFGPVYPFELGVDLMVYGSCVEIVMEKCYPPDKVPR